ARWAKGTTMAFPALRRRASSHRRLETARARTTDAAASTGPNGLRVTARTTTPENRLRAMEMPGTRAIRSAGDLSSNQPEAMAPDFALWAHGPASVPWKNRRETLE